MAAKVYRQFFFLSFIERVSGSCSLCISKNRLRSARQNGEVEAKEKKKRKKRTARNSIRCNSGILTQTSPCKFMRIGVQFCLRTRSFRWKSSSVRSTVRDLVGVQNSPSKFHGFRLSLSGPRIRALWACNTKNRVGPCRLDAQTPRKNQDRASYARDNEKNSISPRLASDASLLIEETRTTALRYAP